MAKIQTSLFKDVFLDLGKEILYLPIWWYSAGLSKAARALFESIKSMEMRLGLKIWVVNIFKPMFGQYDIPGKIISFFMRVFQIVVRALILVFWTALMIVLVCVWIGLPIAIVLGIIINLAAL